MSEPSSPEHGLIQLSDKDPISDESLHALIERIEQTGVQIVSSRRFTRAEVDRVDHVVEVLAMYKDMANEEFNSLGQWVKTHFNTHALDGYRIMKTM